MQFLMSILRVAEAVATGIGVVLGLVPDPTLPRSTEVVRELIRR